MKKLITLFVLFLSIGIANAQTKEETIKWLTEKMMSPDFLKASYAKFEVSSVEFDENYLTIVGMTKTSEYDRKWSLYTDTYSYETYTIDLSKTSVSNGAFISDGNYIKLKYRIVEYTGMRKDELFKGDESSEEYFRNNTELRVNYSFEPDIVERFSKAIEHYKTLMSVKKSTETF
ncbi:hypothetical protein HXZ94_01480 [Empedobacter falsenii]|uniref:hypothetical protein n=1 Tax=Empedobacter falsenii TaxID=343874 RepID=UPI002575BE13|nr:hypothetical protein [Empedobacter falsenii]MDM1297179.1 hypothetical protein [Empedobacter falsenii]MDM1316972.1 hypothetical protein [Empedobacter falsenii]